MSEQTGRPGFEWLRDGVTVAQGALLLVAVILIGTLLSGAGRPRAARAQGPGPGGPGPGGFQGGPPPPFGGRGPMGQEQKVVKQFDKDKDGRLDTDERKTARAWLAENSFGGRGFGGGRRGGRGITPGTPGRALKPADVKIYKDQPLYDPTVLRTLFLQFENADWEQELAAFNNTDVEVPAVVSVDGKVYKDVGIHFRGMSSFMMVPEGSKRSLNLSFDFVNENQNLGG
jgi:hypothetical protein